jgi:TetR/AcrR family transcriptional regulator
MVKYKEPDNQTHDKIFQAATEVFEEKGFAGARMQEIADQAGINKALLHYYFHSKEHLFQAVFRALAKKMFEKIIAIFMMDNISLKEKIKLYYDKHIDILIKNPRLPLFVLEEMAHNPDLLQDITETIHHNEIRDSLYKKHAKELKGYGITKDEMAQLMISVVSLAIFPFIARDVIKIMQHQMGDNKAFNNFMRERKEFASDLIITAMKNHKK